MGTPLVLDPENCYYHNFYEIYNFFFFFVKFYCFNCDQIDFSGSRRLMEPPKGSCLLGRELHPAGQTFHEDRCTVCSCLNGTSVCRRSVCPVLTCPSDRQIHLPGRCCPQCPLVLPVNTSCIVGGKSYKVFMSIYLILFL